MRRFRADRAIKAVLCVVAAVTIGGFVVKELWNILMPQIFALPRLTFWQALGLLVLTKLLFGGFHRHSCGGRRDWKNRIRADWDRMTPEERSRFNDALRCGRGPFAPGAQS